MTAELVRAFPDATIVASDLNPPMLDFAATKVTSPPGAVPAGRRPGVAVRRCRFRRSAVSVRRDVRAGQAGDVRRDAPGPRPGGRLLFNVWERLEANVVPMIIAESVAAAFPDDVPNFSIRIPHGYHDAAVIEPALRAAGFTDIKFETVRLTSRHESAYEAAYRSLPGHADSGRDRGARPGPAGRDHRRHRSGDHGPIRRRPGDLRTDRDRGDGSQLTAVSQTEVT